MPVDNVSLALNMVLKLEQLCELCESKYGAGKEEYGAGIARRAEELPQLVYSSGFVPTLTLIMSKLDKRLWNVTAILTEYLTREELNADTVLDLSNVICGDERGGNCICEELSSRESAGYATILAVVLAYLKHINELSKDLINSLSNYLNTAMQSKTSSNQRRTRQLVNSFAKNIRFPQTLAKYLIDIRSNGKELVTLHTIMPFLLEFKKVAKSLLERE